MLDSNCCCNIFTNKLIYNYKPPNSGSGAGIIVDEDGKYGQPVTHVVRIVLMVLCLIGTQNAANRNKIYPGRPGYNWRWVMAEGASASGNVSSRCNGGNCRYNFADGTFTDIRNGQTFKAGESIDTIKPIN